MQTKEYSYFNHKGDYFYNKEKPLVSVIIPCYNLAGYLEPCLNSCLLQSYSNIEIIVVNDGASDNTGIIIDEYAKRDSRIIAIHKTHEGVARAREAGVDRAMGTYLFFLDGDDGLPLNTIENLVREALLTSADLVCGDYYVESQRGFELNSFGNYGVSNSLEVVKQILKNRLFFIWGRLYHHKLFRHNLNFHPYLRRGEDGSLLVQLVNGANKIVFINHPVYYYRLRPGSVTREKSLKHFNDAIEARFIIEKHVKAYGINKRHNYELVVFICFTIVLYLINANVVPQIDKKFVKDKIRSYLIDNDVFAGLYKKEHRKNYYRLKTFYYFSMPNWQFELAYKLKLFELR